MGRRVIVVEVPRPPRQWPPLPLLIFLLPELLTEHREKVSPPLLPQALGRNVIFKKCSFHVIVSFGNQEGMKNRTWLTVELTDLE